MISIIRVTKNQSWVEWRRVSEGETQRERHTHTHTNTHTQRERERERERERRADYGGQKIILERWDTKPQLTVT